MWKISTSIALGLMFTGCIYSLIDLCNLTVRYMDGIGIFSLGLLIFLVSFIEDMSHYE